jgi:hypothetical protein
MTRRKALYVTEENDCEPTLIHNFFALDLYYDHDDTSC